MDIVESKAEVVRWIFESYLSGVSSTRITAILTEKGVKTPTGNDRWWAATIRGILADEKYTGDTLCQKTYATDTFPFTTKYNEGEKPQYYIENSHPAIISHEVFERARVLRSKRAERISRNRDIYPCSQKINCAGCGAVFVRRESNSGYASWACQTHDRKASACPTGRIAEHEINAAFVRMYNKLKQHEGIILRPALTQLGDLKTALHRGNPAMLAVNKAIAQATEQSYKISKLQTTGLLDTDACAAKLSTVSAQLTALRAERRRLLANDDIDDTIDALKQTVDTIHDGTDRLDTFDEALFAELVERIIAESATKIRFRLFGGIELTETLPEVRR